MAALAHHEIDLFDYSIAQDAAAVALETLRALGREDLIQALWIDWKTRFTSRMGDALYAHKDQRMRRSSERFRDPETGIICRARFSVVLWVRATPEERRQTVVHEVCHLVTAHEAHLAGRPRPQSHGPEWKATMRRAGVTPKRCHNVSTKGLGRKNIPAHCKCGEHYLTPLVAGKILCLQAVYTCRKCHGQVLVNSDLSQTQIRECKRAVNVSIAKKIVRRGGLDLQMGF